MKKAKTKKDIQDDMRIERLIMNYDGANKHMVECKDGYKFDNERTIDIGNISELCYGINNNLDATT